MTEKLKQKPIIAYILYISVSLAAGCVNGLLGTGGGILLTYMFSYLCIGNVKDSLASAMAVILPVSAVSLLTYDGGYFSGSVHFFATAVPAALGGIAGAVLSDKVSAGLLNKIFAILVIYAGVTMIF